ncbi:hypothetical protein SCUCBS95973_001622 [Sporothrix curviconia]|uniref:Ankyrin repeat domain-containing protein n=1 Tax=Sporothrix curviconia TaxID=1260050 RepID=A0ABP0B0T0_9PEZI
MASFASDTPDQDHLRLIAAAARGDDRLLLEVYHGKPDWTTHADRAALRQALQKAAAKGALRMVPQLFAWGAEVNTYWPGEVSPLFRAVEGRYIAMVRVFLKEGALPDWRRPRDQRTALFLAFLHGEYVVVRDLLDAGADARARDHEGRTPLLYAATEKASMWYTATLQLLLDKGADMDAHDGGAVSVVANVQATNPRGITALYLAAKKDRVAMVRYLFKRGADVRVVGDSG